jgi:thiol-disulfide isomerase/thioredoxin
MRHLLLVLMLTMSDLAMATHDVRPFIPGSLAQILADREGRPFILALWSLECQYCPAELRMLGSFKKRHPKLDIVLVATDTPNEAQQLSKRVKSYGMGKVEQWVFSEDMPERLRFEIDRRWYGEIPRTHFYDRAHQREIKTGLINQQFIEDWIARNVTPDSTQR